MKNKKRRMEYISFYNHTGLEKHFTKMAKKGWLIESITNYYWTYRRIEPQSLHFSVTYYPRASEFDPGPSEEQQNFHDFCAHTGWILACTWHQMQVFYNEKENPIPLETDPVLEVETLHKACKKNFLPSYFILLALGLIMGGSFVGRMFVDTIGLLSNASQLLTGFCFVSMAVTSIAELAAYFSWYYKAKKAAQDGIFVDTPSTAKFQISIVILVLTGLVLWFLNLVFSDDPIYTWAAILIFACVIALHIAVNSIKQGLKKAKASRGVNKALTIFACFALSFVMTGSVVSLTLFMDQAGFLQADPQVESIPLSLTDLVEIETDDYIEQNRTNQTILLGERVVHQFSPFETGSTTGTPELHYVVTSVDMPFLYSWVKNQYFNGPVKSDTTIYAMDYTEIDPTAWGAVEAYRQLDDHGIGKTSFLLCYEARLVLIHFDWEPTEEQMAIVGQKLNPQG